MRPNQLTLRVSRSVAKPADELSRYTSLAYLYLWRIQPGRVEPASPIVSDRCTPGSTALRKLTRGLRPALSPSCVVKDLWSEEGPQVK